ncbi:hypothetical protein JYU34_013176 [Plutella xylostella]|uniref:Raptor N-terminal CASPase-like domain-containing protein n=1 Tax=Plutella xylostella TaxID=51655 RepID=A0ABQ7QDA0_PLUXY|nr:hypothetical protein JYU34_013176 [Plutella xylostella]
MTDMPPYLAAKDEESESGQVDSETSGEIDDWDLPLVFDEPKQTELYKPDDRVEHSWRLKEKYKTHCVALVLCLNVGVDPPDVVKTHPCARLECWIDPLSLSPTKALENIGHALQAQYERWQPRARYKQSLDPTSEEVKKLCCSLRRNAKDERVLFHYNGHGVPKPTSQGEIWLFNRAFTQYIPLSMYDLQSWMGAPSLYVYDCSNAGVIVDNFKIFADQHERDYELQKSKAGTGTPPPLVSYAACLQLGACAAGQALPAHPELPADLFTACLTTPVKMAVRWFVLRSTTRVTPTNVHDLIDKIPGQVTDRRTMLGELNWIFTAITDTIAWNSLAPELFQQLFRADLLTASLCRNFLLADRIMRCYNCTPVSSPALPSLASHPLWQAWDQTLDLALAQLPGMLGPERRPYQHSPFFREQLTAFQVWLDLGSPSRPPPDQLPMVLQVLLSTLHRVRALQILCRFLALGPWAVRAVLAVGIFPYMLKLLQASAPDLRASMVYIWAKIIAVDPSCQVDLVNAKGHKYFLSVLQDPTVDMEHRTLAAYVLCGIVDNYPAGQEAALQGGMISICLEQLSAASAPSPSPSPAAPAAPARLLRWLCAALARLWQRYDDARWAGVRDNAHEKLAPLLTHPDPDVRCVCIFALGASCPRARTEHAGALQQQAAAALLQRACDDAAPPARQAILHALQWMVLSYEQYLVSVATAERARRGARVDPGQDALRARPAPPLPTIGRNSVYTRLWAMLTTLARDPHPQVAAMADDIVAYITNQLDTVGRDFEMVRSSGGGSSSLPPSPNTHAGALGHRRGRSMLHNAIAEDPSPHRERPDSTSSTETIKKPIVTFDYIERAAAAFAWEESEFEGVGSGARRRRDLESRAHQQRVWRYGRNAELRKQARALETARITRLESQVFHSRCPLPPAAVLFHPYEQHVAVASRDNFGIWDWGTGARLAAGAWRRGCGRITALAWLNAHDRALLVAASHSGALTVYRPSGSSAEPRLVSAWRALEPWPAAEPRPPPAQPLYSTMGSPYPAPPTATLLAHCPRRASLACAGHAPDVALWDLARALRHASIPTESQEAVSALSQYEDTLYCGFADGVVRCWDVRAPPRAAPAPAPAPARAAAVLLAQRRGHTLVTACVDGQVTLLDVRRADTPLHSLLAPAPLAAAAVHPRASLLACGSVNQSISLFDLSGAALHTIKFHEGFMGARIGPVSCLSFHPLRVAMGVGSKDSTVSVYVSEPRR